MANGGIIDEVNQSTLALEFTGGVFNGTNQNRVSWKGGDLSQYVNRGNLRVQAQTGEILTVAGILFNEGRLVGSGTISVQYPNSILYNQGTLAPGLGPGTLAIDGSVGLGVDSELALELGGRHDGEYDQLLITERLHHNGRVRLLLTNDFIPKAVDRFQATQAKTRTGRFQFIELPPLPAGLSWRSEHLETDGALEVALVPESYGTWRHTWFSGTDPVSDASSKVTADPDGDGVINLFELLFGLSPTTAETTESRQNLPRAVILPSDVAPRLAVDFSIPETLPVGSMLQLEASDSLIGDAWSKIATLKTPGDWTRPGRVELAPPSGGGSRFASSTRCKTSPEIATCVWWAACHRSDPVSSSSPSRRDRGSDARSRPPTTTALTPTLPRREKENAHRGFRRAGSGVRWNGFQRLGQLGSCEELRVIRDSLSRRERVGVRGSVKTP